MYSKTTMYQGKIQTRYKMPKCCCRETIIERAMHWKLKNSNRNLEISPTSSKLNAHQMKVIVDETVSTSDTLSTSLHQHQIQTLKEKLHLIILKTCNENDDKATRYPIGAKQNELIIENVEITFFILSEICNKWTEIFQDKRKRQCLML